MNLSSNTANPVPTASAAVLDSAPRPGLWLPVWTLAVRETTRFFRQRTRVVGALGQPLIFWVLFGAGLRGSFDAPQWSAQLARKVTYQEYFFPGVAVLIVMFTAIFSTISIIEDRREGFLQGVLVAPIPRASLVFGKLCGGTLLAVAQAGLFLGLGPALSIVGLAPAFELGLSAACVPATAGFLVLVAFQLTALGYLIAWPMNSTQGFHAIMSVFLMPMWLLSGAFFPGGDSGWLSWIIRLNPLTYGLAGLRRCLYGADLPVSPTLPGMGPCLAVTLLATLTYTVACVVMTSRHTSASVR